MNRKILITLIASLVLQASVTAGNNRDFKSTFSFDHVAKYTILETEKPTTTSELYFNSKTGSTAITDSKLSPGIEDYLNAKQVTFDYAIFFPDGAVYIYGKEKKDGETKSICRVLSPAHTRGVVMSSFPNARGASLTEDYSVERFADRVSQSESQDATPHTLYGPQRIISASIPPVSTVTYTYSTTPSTLTTAMAEIHNPTLGIPILYKDANNLTYVVTGLSNSIMMNSSTSALKLQKISPSTKTLSGTMYAQVEIEGVPQGGSEFESQMEEVMQKAKNKQKGKGKTEESMDGLLNQILK